MKRTSVVLVALFMAALAPTAVADGIPFTGTALVGNAADLNFSMTGPSLSLFQSAPDGPGPGGGLIACTPGTVCNFNFTIGVGIFDLNCVCTGGSFQGKTAGFLVGALTFTGSAFVSSFSSTLTLPVTLAAQLTGYQLLFSPDTGNSLGAELFSLSATGSGILTAIPNDTGQFFNPFSYTYSGTATVVPEPTTWLLFASGFLAIAAANAIRWVRSRVTT